MIRWIQALAATSLWAFVLSGFIGLAEAVSQWFRFGPPPAHIESGPVAAVAPSFTLYGWMGFLVATLVYTPLAFFLYRRPHPRRVVFAYVIGAALSFIMVVYLGYLIKDQPFADWWQGKFGPLWPLKALAWIGITFVFAIPAQRFANYLVGNPRRNLFIPVAVVVVATALWPDWRDEAAREQVGDLVRIAGDDSPPAGPNVLMITVDTLRRDKLSCVSAEAPPTPAFDALAEEGFLYTNVWGVSSWTLPNMAAILTGQPPRVLGLRQYVGLPESATTLAESAWRAGWWTAAITANPYLGYEYGFQRGFAEYEHALMLEPLSPASRSVLVRELTRYAITSLEPNDASVLVGKTIRWLRVYDNPRPFFLWLHLMDPHLPYRWHELDHDDESADLPEHHLLANDRFEALAELRAMAPDYPPDLQRGVERLYEREVRYTDQWVGRLVAELKASDRWDETLVVLVADHGEEFFEHGGFEHGHSLQPEVAGVPMIVKLPRGATPTRISKPVNLLDLVPTLCHELAWPLPPELPGSASLWEVDGRAAAAPTDLVVMENMLYGGEHQAWWQWPYLRLENLETAEVHWYDLAADPEALHPLPSPPADLAERRERVGDLLELWDARAEQLDAVGREDATLNETSRRQLESLGY